MVKKNTKAYAIECFNLGGFVVYIMLLSLKISFNSFTSRYGYITFEQFHKSKSNNFTVFEWTLFSTINVFSFKRTSM